MTRYRDVDIPEKELEAVRTILRAIGEDPTREGLRETPERFIMAFHEWARGYSEHPKQVLTCFEDGAEQCGDEFVVVHNVPILSKCEHHLADFFGIAHIGYIPDGKIVGLSKLVRVANIYARRLQVQERLTNQIADAIDMYLAPKGVGVIIRATHTCMSSRGVRIQGSTTSTAAMRGVVLEKPAARAEFLALCAAAEK